MGQKQRFVRDAPLEVAAKHKANRQRAYDRLARHNARSLESRDRLVSAIAMEIDSRRPGSLLYLNRTVLRSGARTSTVFAEVDIETDSALIEVKSGSPHLLAHQLLNLATIGDRNKLVIGFVPNANPMRRRELAEELRRQGVVVNTPGSRVYIVEDIDTLISLATATMRVNTRRDAGLQVAT